LFSARKRRKTARKEDQNGCILAKLTHRFSGGGSILAEGHIHR